MAVTETGRLVIESRFAEGEDVSAAALSALEGWAREGAPHRARALAVEAQARWAMGDRAGALAAADALAAEPDAAASLEGHVARFHLLLGWPSAVHRVR